MRLTLLAGLAIAIWGLIPILGAVAQERHWKSMSADGVHDPSAPAIGTLQEPAEALSLLPRDSAGNRVDWVKALTGNYISPRANVLPGTEVHVLDLDILMMRTGEMPIVRFPHRQHTEWLDCSNCHEHIFKSQAGTTPVNMLEILQGNYCGQCHGAVAFPLTQCRRCHSVPRKRMGQ